MNTASLLNDRYATAEKDGMWGIVKIIPQTFGGLGNIA